MHSRSGFTLLELLMVLLILSILAGIALPKLFDALDTTRQSRAIADLKTLQKQIDIHKSVNGKIPDTWDALKAGPMPRDPWGNPYVYNSHGFVLSLLFRTNGILIPINTDYDLYSKGPDGNSVPNILLLLSQDDIVRADEGEFIGLVEDY